MSNNNGIITYNKMSATNALKCLMQMRELENTPKFGELKSDYPKSTRYSIEESYKEIDSTFYTSKATSLLLYAMDLFSQDVTTEDELNLYIDFIGDIHDVTNDSSGEYANFNGDEYFLENEFGSIEENLYAYYSEFEVLTVEEEQEIFKRILSSEKISDRLAIKKTENINGEEIDFYYLGGNWHDLSSQMLEHEYNVEFLSDRMPSNLLSSINNNRGCNDIISIAYDCLPREEKEATWAAYAEYTYGSIVLKSGLFDQVICHELGHHFDTINNVDLGLTYFTVDYNRGNFGKWDLLAKKYADDIFTIRTGADISCGYEPDEMRDMHYEFYAEAFQLYFYSPETRAALPEKVRKTIEAEIEKYANG